MSRHVRHHRRSPPGTAPGHLHVHPDAPRPVVQVMAYGPDGLEEAILDDVRELARWRRRAPVTWVDVRGLGDAAVLEAVAAEFGLHPLALEDVVHTDQRPKLDQYGELLFLALRAGNLERLTTEQDCIALGKDFVLTFQELPEDGFARVRERLRAGRERLRTSGPDYLAYALVDVLVDSFFPLVEHVGAELERLEQQVMSGGQALDLMAAVHAARSRLLALRHAVWPLRDLLRALAGQGGELLCEETRLYLRDCADHAVLLQDSIETQRELGQSLTELHLLMVGHRTNEITKVLTVISTIFIPVSFIAGVYGMNFNPVSSPWNMPELNAYWGYPVALGLMAVVAISFLWWLRRRGWIGGRGRGRPA